MARKIKPGTQYGVAPAKITSMVNEIDAAEARIEKERGRFMNFCRKQRDTMNDCIATLVQLGLERPAIKLKLDERRALRKIAQKKAELDGEQPDMFDYMGHCLGEADEEAPAKNGSAKEAPKPPKPETAASVRDAADRAEERLASRPN